MGCCTESEFLLEDISGDLLEITGGLGVHCGNDFLGGPDLVSNRRLFGQLGLLGSSGLGLSGLNLQLGGEVLSSLGDDSLRASITCS